MMTVGTFRGRRSFAQEEEMSRARSATESETSLGWPSSSSGSSSLASAPPSSTHLEFHTLVGFSAYLKNPLRFFLTDDNVPKNTSPAVLGLVLGTRTLGPGLGYVLGSASLKLYVAPGRAPGLAEGDDGWLGAWWLGFVVVGGLTAVIAPILALFPQRLPGEEETEARKLEKENLQEPETAGEFVRHTLACAVRLASNKIYVFNVLSAVTALIGFVGFGTFIPKYFEFHFRQEASRSGFASLGSSVATGLGVVISGQVIARW